MSFDPLGVLLENNNLITASNLLIACGGMTYQSTGSTGTAYKWAIKAGHKVSEPKPSLTGYLSTDPWIKNLAGLSLKDIELKLFSEQVLIAQEKGALLFTHWGITGPGVFKISSLAANKPQKELYLKINLFAEEKTDQLKTKLKNYWQAHSKRKVINCLDEFVSERLANYIIESVFSNLQKTVSEINNKEFGLLISYLSELKININGKRPSGEEIVTAGGVCLNEIEPQTMASKLVKGLYFAGEVLDVDGFTGGYNLQAAWSTGWLAGNSII